MIAYIGLFAKPKVEAEDGRIWIIIIVAGR